MAVNDLPSIELLRGNIWHSDDLLIPSLVTPGGTTGLTPGFFMKSARLDLTSLLSSSTTNSIEYIQMNMTFIPSLAPDEQCVYTSPAGHTI
jgi:hypothetical protein